jgi:hypothetical protein
MAPEKRVAIPAVADPARSGSAVGVDSGPPQIRREDKVAQEVQHARRDS